MTRALRSRWTRIAVPLAAAALTTLLAAPAATAAPTTDTGTSALTCYDHPCITGIRAATHADYDRLVFDLTAGTAVTNTYTNTTGAYMPMSGQTEYLDVKGDSYLFVTMDPVHLASGLTFNKSFGLPTVKAVQLTNFHAARGEFGISLGPSTSYRVFTLTAPNRVVVDVYR
ncbi:AMIN-like domain-containing (lipo)protein [Streptomyces sp. NPDC003327]